MEIKKICIITDEYPTDQDPIYTFLDEVVCGFADRNIECIVICPKSIVHNQHKAKTRIKTTKSGNTVRILCPHYFPFSGLEIGNIKMWKYTINSIFHVVYSTFKKYVGKCDVIYSHFFKNAIIASKLGQRENIPVFVASGESSFETGKKFYNEYRDDIYKIKGVIAVSTDVKLRILKYDLLPQSTNVIVLPNGVNLSKFEILNRNECRNQLGISTELFIVAFVGHFIDRKGINIVLEAINQCSDIYGFFIGGEKLPVDCDKALFVGKVPHDKMNVYLSAADVFVLPSRDEGCCNAIVEAQVMGMPIIASNLPFNFDILNDNTALLVDPNNVDEIKNAMISLKNNKDLFVKMKMKSIEQIPNRDIELRIDKILSFMESFE